MKIIWTSLAKKSYNQNIIYLVHYWNRSVVQDFILEVERTMKIIQQNPKCFEKWEFDNSFQKGYIHKNVSFYYKIHHAEIVVYLFWNNFQSPKKLKKELLNSKP